MNFLTSYDPALVPEAPIRLIKKDSTKRVSIFSYATRGGKQLSQRGFLIKPTVNQARQVLFLTEEPAPSLPRLRQAYRVDAGIRNCVLETAVWISASFSLCALETGWLGVRKPAE
jgi:hypothetical protein